MDELLKTAATQVPGLVVLAFLVRSFLVRDKERDENASKLGIQRDEFIRAMHNDHLIARKESREAINDNALATRQNAVATVENTEVLRSLREVFRQRDGNH